jgi:hypothetical protein
LANFCVSRKQKGAKSHPVINIKAVTVPVLQ